MHLIFGYNRTKSRAEALIPFGLHVCDSIEEVLGKSDLIFVSVLDDAASREVFYGVGGILEYVNEGKVVIDMSTIKS